MNGFKLFFSHRSPKRLMPSLQLGRMHRSIMSTVCGHTYIHSCTYVAEQPLTFKEPAEIVAYTRQLFFSKAYYKTVDNFWIISELQFSFQYLHRFPFIVGFCSFEYSRVIAILLVAGWSLPLPSCLMDLSSFWQKRKLCGISLSFLAEMPAKIKLKMKKIL